MPKWLKVVLILGGISVVLVGGAIGGFMLWLRASAPEIREAAKKKVAEGTAFGKTSTGQGCLTEALRQSDACDGLRCEVLVNAFVRACLKSATVAPEFCQGVPPPTEMAKSVSYRLETCRAAKVSNEQRCGRLLSQVQQHCHPATDRSDGD